jgi:undecaprenyl-diphosphatase
LVFGSGLYELKDALGETASERVFSLPETFIATAVAFVIGYAVIAWLLKYVTTKSFAPFIIYRICLGSLLILLLSLGVIS